MPRQIEGRGVGQHPRQHFRLQPTRETGGTRDHRQVGNAEETRTGERAECDRRCRAIEQDLRTCLTEDDRELLARHDHRLSLRRHQREEPRYHYQNAESPLRHSIPPYHLVENRGTAGAIRTRTVDEEPSVGSPKRSRHTTSVVYDTCLTDGC